VPIDVSVLVKRTPRAADPLTVTFPCGAEVAAQLPSLSIPNGAQLAKQLMAQVNAALAPLAPLFKLIDLLLVIVEVVQDPTKLLTLVEKLLKAKDLLLKLVPAISVPLMAVQLLDVIIAYLEGLQAMLAELAAFVAKIDAARAQADQYPELRIVIEASEDNLDAQMEALDKGLGPLQKLIQLLNVFMSIAGLPSVPSLSSIGADPTTASEILADALRELRRVRGMIPV
jgi:hypothetical protein